MYNKILLIQLDIFWMLVVALIIIITIFIVLLSQIKRFKQTLKEAQNKNYEYKELLTESATSNKELLDEIVSLKQKNTDLIAKLNREINSSINSIMGMANLLKDTVLNKEQSKNTDTIIKCSESLLQNARNIFNKNTNQIHPINSNVMNNRPTGKSELPLSAEFVNEYPLRILIAEDDNINQILATKMLNKLGYKPDIVSNGKQALEIVSEKMYDVILMDGLMPEMDGFEATRMIRLCLETQPVIIALTASTMYGDKEKCLQAGMDDYISKPIDINELAATLQKWAEEKRVVVA